MLPQRAPDWLLRTGMVCFVDGVLVDAEKMVATMSKNRICMQSMRWTYTQGVHLSCVRMEFLYSCVFIIYYLFPYVPNDVHQILNGSPWCSSRVFSTAPQFISYLLLKVFPFRQGSKRVSTLSSHKNHYLGGASYLPLVFFFGFFLYVPITMANC